MPDAVVSSPEPAAPAAGAVPGSVDEYRQAQAAEYAVYVAAVPIDVRGARAFNVGDPVPVSHVESGVVEPEQVHKITTKTGRAAAGLPEKG